MERNTRLEQYFVVSGLVALLIWISFGFLAPIVLGLLMSLVLFPAHAWVLKRLKCPPPLAALIITLGLTLGVILPLTYVGIVVSRDLMGLSQILAGGAEFSSAQNEPAVTGSQFQDMSASVQIFVAKIQNWITEKGIYKVVPGGVEGVQKGLQWILSSVGSAVAPLLGTLAKSAPTLAIDIGFFLIALFYGFIDGPRLAGFFNILLPFKPRDLENFRETTQQISRGVVAGSLLTGLFQGTVIGLGYTIFDIPRPFFFGILTMIFSFIPFLGSAPAGLGAVIYLIVQDKIGPAIGMGIFFLVATLSDNVIKPWVLKGASEIHPLIALISVLGGLMTFGFTGLFLGPLIAALAISGLRILAQADQTHT